MSVRLLSLSIALLATSLMVQPAQAETKWHWDKGTIIVDSPERPAGQKTALNLALKPIPVIRIAFVGLGMRGPGAVERWTHIPGVRIVALCDYEKGRAENCQKYLTKAGLSQADIYYGEEGYRQLCQRSDINLVYVATDWLHHVPVAKCALENNKNVAIEVPSAMNLQDCWDLVNMAEQKQLHCMILENCCYDTFELNTLNMAQHNVFGEILHVQGAYIHNLSEFWKEYWHNWRLDYNQKHRGDVYSTHGLGPVAQLLDIHRGDRMKTLVAMDTKPVLGPSLVKDVTGQECAPADFRNGDHTTTLIKTENGKVIEIQHDVMNPQPYNRLYQLTGTKGFANKYPTEGYALSGSQMQASGVKPQVDNLNTHQFMSDADRASLTEKFRSPILKRYQAEAKKVGGHGGMDFIMDSRLAYCLRNGLPLDLDVYDLAEWCCLAELGSLSMDNNNASVQIPDFTRGHCYDDKGYKLTEAPAAQDSATLLLAENYTQTLKAKGADAAEKLLKKTLKKSSK